MKLLTVCVLLYALLCEANPVTHPELPAVIMVPGAFHSSSVFEKVIAILRQANYHHVDALDLRSVGHLVGRQRDIQPVVDALHRHINDGRDVVLVGNSYGCTVIGEAVNGFEAYPLTGASRIRRGFESKPSKGRVLGLIMLAGYIPPISEITHPETKPNIQSISPPFFRYTNDSKVWADGDLTNFPPQKAFYNLLPPADADYWASKLNFDAFDALNATAKYVPYTGDFRVVYVAGNQDNTITPTIWGLYVDQPDAKFTRVEHIDADHIPMLSRPAEVAALIRKYAENTGPW